MAICWVDMQLEPLLNFKTGLQRMLRCEQCIGVLVNGTLSHPLLQRNTMTAITAVAMYDCTALIQAR